MTLNWPQGRKRTASPKRAKFSRDLTNAGATADLIREVKSLRARDLVVEVDNRINLDGTSYSRVDRSDKGVVVRFTLPDGRKIAMCCDAWDNQAHNIRAIAYTLEAKRDIGRWGCATEEQEYAGYAALPASSSVSVLPPLHETLGIASDAAPDLYKAAWKVWVVNNHPDKGGNSDRFARVKSQYETLFATVVP